MFSNMLGHSIPVVLCHYTGQRAAGPRMAEALVEKVQAHPLEWSGEPHLGFRVEGSIWDFFQLVSFGSDGGPLRFGVERVILGQLTLSRQVQMVP